jgi:hypothetical protein
MTRRFLRHHLNALHVMAFCVHRGFPRPVALRIARGWERLIHPFLYGSVRALTLGPVAALAVRAGAEPAGAATV